MKYALATVKLDGKATPVIQVAGRFFALADVAPELLQPDPARGLMALFDDWQRSDEALGALADTLADGSRGTAIPAPAGDAFLAPLLRPAKLMLGGANYYEHVWHEAKKPDFRKETATPVFFLKAPSTSLVGSGKSVRFPAQSTQLDWEIELAVVAGRRLKRATLEEAAAAIAGYAIGIDLSARDWQSNPKHPFKFDLFTGKTFDDSCPMGPLFVPARWVDDRNLSLQLWVNGALKQNGNTSDMIWTPAELLADASQHLTIEPGDILLTGTPAGTGIIRQEFLKVGDRVDAEITGLGRLSFEIVPDASTTTSS